MSITIRTCKALLEHKTERDKYDKSHIADYQNGVDLSDSLTVGMTFVKINLDFKLYVLDNYVIIIMFH
jgi:hypothetical protein